MWKMKIYLSYTAKTKDARICQNWNTYLKKNYTRFDHAKSQGLQIDKNINVTFRAITHIFEEV